MHLDNIRSPYRARPFRPFMIFTASGEGYPVRHPEFMAIDPDERVIIVMHGGGQVPMIDVESVTEITYDFNKQQARGISTAE